MSDEIVAFCCENSAYAAADLAGREGLHYSERVRIIRVPCVGRVDALHILKAFEAGCAAVVVLGCEFGACRHINGNKRAKRRVEYTNSLLSDVGMRPKSLAMFTVAPNAPHRFVNIIEKVERSLKEPTVEL